MTITTYPIHERNRVKIPEITFPNHVSVLCCDEEHDTAHKALTRIRAEAPGDVDQQFAKWSAIRIPQVLPNPSW